jgi:hypothetical protein
MRMRPDFGSEVHVWTSIESSPELQFLVMLKAYGLLDESTRASAFQQIKQRAVSTPDAGFLAPMMRKLLTGMELHEIQDAVREEVIGNLPSIVDDWETNYDPSDDGDPDDYFQQLGEALDEFRSLFPDDDDAASKIDAAERMIERAVIELEEKRPIEPDYSDEYFDDGVVSMEVARSLFDDVDE